MGARPSCLLTALRAAAPHRVVGMSDQQPPPEAGEPEAGEPTSAAPPTPEAPAAAPPPPPPAPPAQPPAAGYAPPPTWPPQGATPPAAYPPPPGYAAPAAYPTQGGYPPPYAYAPAPLTSTNAIIGLVLAIASWVVCPVIPAIIALVLAAKSQQEILASQGRVGGDGLNLATRIISWINIGFWALLIVGFGVIIAITLLAGAAQRA